MIVYFVYLLKHFKFKRIFVLSYLSYLLQLSMIRGEYVPFFINTHIFALLVYFNQEEF